MVNEPDEMNQSEKKVRRRLLLTKKKKKKENDAKWKGKKTSREQERVLDSF